MSGEKNTVNYDNTLDMSITTPLIFGRRLLHPSVVQVLLAPALNAVHVSAAQRKHRHRFRDAGAALAQLHRGDVHGAHAHLAHRLLV